MNGMRKEERDALRQNIARQTADFLRKGGKIIQVPYDFSGIPSNGLLPFRLNNTEAPRREQEDHR